MAKTPQGGDGKDTAAGTTEPPATPSEAAPAAAPPQVPHPPQLQVDDSKASAAYANFFRVTGTPEETIIDFGLTDQLFAPATKPVQITQRIVTNYYTAKRLLQVLHLTIQRHEAAFGVIETDVAKRARPGLAARPQSPAG